jgi:hypothetical protein
VNTQNHRLELRQDLHQLTPAQFLGTQKGGLQLDACPLKEIVMSTSINALKLGGASGTSLIQRMLINEAAWLLPRIFWRST